ncbi:predicted protein [Sclerotinia sclerotiorum 1980 UF-70]|uniref:Uncharacterized protein n=1 Tax=Sclerotinia sclerotiorum (strain ATCC 18683 / 1980 / Ss-1) TaxID=665079 RepID=A7EEM2_SCLS1|nr:predicted protein [Sclerotinia sclerotiorum 1980 UF-70]EDO01288.1 predicted protein [Sclerotinia sclerotiorum 1980 UF-70]
MHIKNHAELPSTILRELELMHRDLQLTNGNEVEISGVIWRAGQGVDVSPSKVMRSMSGVFEVILMLLVPFLSIDDSGHLFVS